MSPLPFFPMMAGPKPWRAHPQVQRFDAMARSIYTYAFMPKKTWTEFDRNYSFTDLCTRALSGSCTSYSDPLQLFGRRQSTWAVHLWQVLPFGLEACLSS